MAVEIQLQTANNIWQRQKAKKRLYGARILRS